MNINRKVEFISKWEIFYESSINNDNIIFLKETLS